MSVRWQLPAAELSEAFARGETTPSEHLELLFERIERIDPVLNGIVTLNPGARADAADSSARLRTKRARSPLEGVPVTIKDNIKVAGLRSTWGSRLYANHVPERDELPVARLRDAGAVILGKTNVPEFTLQGYTDNPLFGVTRNPWDPALTPGGSSGGAVAGVAAGLAPLALATDGGGSIRRPASHTGLVGLKPSRGRVARSHGFPTILLDYEVAGPIARTVADVVAAMHVLSGAHVDDPLSAAFAEQPFKVPDRAPTRRILYVPTFGAAPVDRQIATSVAAAAQALERLGHGVEIASHFDLTALVDELWPVISQVGLSWLLEQHPDWRGRVGSAIAAMADAGAAIGATRYFEALDRVAGLRANVARLFTEYDVLLTPTAAALPWLATETHPETIAGCPVGPRGSAIFTGFVNAAGLPAITLPCTPADNGLPIGMQLIGPFGADGMLCALASQFEQASPWAHRWPSLAFDGL